MFGSPALGYLREEFNLKKNIKKGEKKMKRNKGITLIALIITIIVMLILVGVTVNVIINSNILSSAKNTAKKWQDEAQKEAGNLTITIGGVEYASIEDYIKGNKIYDPDGWELAWTCADGGTWSRTINKGETAEGDIVAKLYKTGNKITPSTCKKKLNMKNISYSSLSILQNTLFCF